MQFNQSVRFQEDEYDILIAFFGNHTRKDDRYFHQQFIEFFYYNQLI